MQPNIIFISMMLLSVVLCGKAELRPAALEGNPHHRGPDILSSNYFHLTFEQYKFTYQKSYTSLAEQNYRRLIFQQNLADLNRHNQNPQRKYNMKPNAFLDVSKDEFKQVYATVHAPDEHSRNVTSQLQNKRDGHQHHDHRSTSNHTSNPTNLSEYDRQPIKTKKQRSEETSAQENNPTNQIENRNQNRLLQVETITDNSGQGKTGSNANNISNTNINTQNNTGNTTQKWLKDAYIDWSIYAGPVRFQGFCGACYAFSTVDTVSAHLAINTFSFFYQLSVQQIIDCSDNGLTFGCRGGYLEGALTQIQMKGVVSETVYPFTSGGKGFAGKCKIQTGAFKVKSFQTLIEGDCPSVVRALYKGPVSAGISGYNLRFYDSGVFNDCTSKDQLDHAIMIVGYVGGVGWKIKNSWGADWGEEGFAWIAEGNTCGICNMTVSVVV